MKHFRTLLKVHLLGIFKTQKNHNTLLVLGLTCFLLLFFGLTYGATLYMYFSHVGDKPYAFPIMLGISFIFATIYGVMTVKNSLFNNKDQELLMKLPIQYQTIISVKVLTILIESLGAIILFSIPSLLITLFSKSMSLPGFLVSLFLMISLSLLATGLAVLLGFIYSQLRARLPFSGKIFGIITALLIFFFTYIYIRFMMSSFTLEGNGQLEIIKNIILVPPFAWITRVILDESFIMTLLIFIIALALVAAMVVLFAKTYKKLNTLLNASRREKVKELNNKKESPIKALVRKDLIKLFKSPNYLINSAFLSLIIIVGLVMILLNQDYIKEVMKVTEIIPQGLLLPVAFVFMAGSSQMSAITISMERDQFWILKTLPVPTKTIILAKAIPQIIISMIPLVLITLVGLILLPEFSPVLLITSLLVGIIWCIGNALMGVLINLNYPKLEAENEAEVIKRSISTFVMMIYTIFSGIVFVIILFLCQLLIPTFFMIPVLVLSALINYLLIRFVFKKGVPLFKQL